MTASALVPFSIDAATHTGPVALTVSDLQRSLDFYTRALGLQILDSGEPTVTLGVPGTPLLHLTAMPGLQPWDESRTGLYHFAILLPNRVDLGLWLAHWLSLGYPFPGQGDHLVSEAFYLRDPDGHGIEVYRDRPRSEWTMVGGMVKMASDPIDVQGMLDEAAASGKTWQGAPAGTTMGHVHLQVGDIPAAADFYFEVLGFDIVASMPSALFVSAGGYHHHIGMNIWHSRGSGPAGDDIAKMQYFTILFGSEEARQAVVDRVHAAGLNAGVNGQVVVIQDPWQNHIHLEAQE